MSTKQKPSSPGDDRTPIGSSRSAQRSVSSDRDDKPPRSSPPVGSARSARPVSPRTPVLCAIPGRGDKSSVRSERSVSPTTPTTAKRYEEAEIAKIAKISVAAIDKIVIMVNASTMGTSGASANRANIQQVVERVVGTQSASNRPESVEDIFLLVLQKAKTRELRNFSTPNLPDFELRDLKAALNVKGNRVGGSRKKHRRKRQTKSKSRTCKNKTNQK